jgi:trimethylamine--corrinoid protein Co-methyltransferase
VDQETLAVDVIAQVRHGGNYLRDEHTLKHFKAEHFIPDLTDRRPRGIWERGGGKDILQRAKEKVRTLLAEHEPKHLAADVVRDLDKAVAHICRRRGVRCEDIVRHG